MKSNNITLKIKYETDRENLDIILSFIKNYNNVLRFTYNRVQEGIKSTKDLTELQKQLNNIFIDSHFKNSSIFEAKSIQDSNLIFGGKKLFLDRCKNKICKEDFGLKRLVPISSVGESNQKGNRKFSIINENTILFKPTKDIHINLQLKAQGKNYKEALTKLINLQNSKQISITYKLDLEYVYITYDNSSLKSNFYKTKKNRVIAIDLNPNYLGYSVVDWLSESNYNIIDKGVYDISKINKIENNLKVSFNDNKKRYIKNKRDYEVVKIAYELTKLCKHYKCEVFSIEELNIKSNNLEKGRRLNKLINNQWNRNKFINVLSKLINSSSTALINVNPRYSSILGNLIYRKEELPDMILSSIEIGRRGIEFQNQYLLNIKEHKKNIILPDFNLIKNSISKSLEELKVESQIINYDELFSVLKKSKLKYRFLLEKCKISRVLSKNYSKSYVLLYKFI